MNTDKCLSATEARELIQKAKDLHEAKESIKAQELRKAEELFRSLESIEYKTVRARELRKAEKLAEKATSSELSTLEVKGYAGIDPEAAGLLVKWTGHLKLSDLKTLGKEIAGIFAARPRHRGTISLDGLRELPGETAMALQKGSGNISIDPRKLDKLCPVAARFLVDDFRKGDSFRELSLNSLTTIDVGTAEVLACFQGPLSCGLKTLDEPVAKAFKRYKGPFPIQTDKLESMDDPSAEILAERFANPVQTDKSSNTVGKSAESPAANQRGVKGTKRKVLVLTALRHMSDAACQSFVKHNTGVRVNPLNFETIGKMGARRIAECVRQIRLDGLKALSKETAEALISGPQDPEDKDSLSLNGLEHLEPGVAEVLSDFAGALSLSGLGHLSQDQAAALATHHGELHLDGLKGLPENVADALAKHRGGLSLNGLKQIGIDAAKCLSAHQGIVSLAGLSDLSDDVFDALGAYSNWGNGRHDHLKTLHDRLVDALAGFDGPVFLKGLSALSLAHAGILAKGKGDLDIGLVSLSADIASALATSKGTHHVVFSRLQELRADVADALAKFWSLEFPLLGTLSAESANGLRGCRMLRMNGLKMLSDEAAEALTASQKLIWLELNGLSELHSSVAGQLAKLKWGTLVLNGVKNITPDSHALLGCRCTLALNGLSKLTPENARTIAHSPCSELYLSGIKGITRQVAEALARFKGKMVLSQIAELDEETALALSKASGKIDLRGLKSVSHRGLFALRENAGVTGLDNVRECPLSNTNKAVILGRQIFDEETRNRLYQRILETIVAECSFEGPSLAPSNKAVTKPLEKWLFHPVTLEPRTYGMRKQVEYCGLSLLNGAISGLCLGRYKDCRLDEAEVLHQYLHASIEKEKKGDEKSRLNTMLSFESWHKLSRFVIKAADNACLSTLRSNKLRLDPKTSIHDPSSSPDEENRSGELMFSRSLWGNSELASFQDFLLKEECDKIYREVIKAFSGEIKAYVCELTYKADYLEEIPPLTWKDMVEKVSISFNNAKGPAITQSTVSRTISKFNKLFLEMVDKLEPGRRSMLANKICKVHQKPTNV